MNILKPLESLVDALKSKNQLEKEISELKQAIMEAERSVSICESLEKDIPSRIAAIRCRIYMPGGRTEEVSNAYPDLIREARVVQALEHLQKDLPAIRAHWTKRLAALAA